MKLATIKDIAKRLGINHGTVSRALRNDPKVNIKTRELVQKTAEEMDYTPNMAAKGLARGKSNTIAIVTFSYFTTFTSELMRGIEPEMLKTSYDMLYYTTSRYTNIGTQGREAYIFEKILNEKRAEALIIFSGPLFGKPGIIERYRQAGIQLIFIEGKNSWGHRVHYDNIAAGEMAVKHLLERKREKIGLLTGNTTGVLSFKERKEGFLNALYTAGRQASNNIYEFQEDSPEMIRNGLNFFIKNNVGGVYTAASDPYALRLMQEAKKMGLRVPEDLAVVGQDDTVASQAAEITTIRQPIAEMGRKAVEIAVKALTEKDAPMMDEMFYPELIIRRTT